MPSKEAAVLRARYKAFADRLAANPGVEFGGRHDPFEGISLLAAEPTDVTYDEVAAAGSSAIWANPAGCDTERVLVSVPGRSAGQSVVFRSGGASADLFDLRHP